MTVRAHADGVNATASWREIAVGVIGITVTLLAFIGGTHLTAPYHEGMTQFVEDKLDPLQSQGIETATLLLSMQTQLTRIEAKLTEQDKNITGFYRDYGAGLSWSQRQAEGVER